MPLLGQAAVAMWWNVDPSQRSDFGDWHSHEHFPERMSIPGFRRGSRWMSASNPRGFFVLYELERYETLTSPGYLDRLNAPTPWSVRMMPHHLDMVRSQCRVEASFGGGVGGALATVRLSPQPGRDAELKAAILAVLGALPARPGMTGGHLLRTDTPKTAAPTAEQKIRGGDNAADWIVLVGGYDAAEVDHVMATLLSAATLEAAGAKAGIVADRFCLAYALTGRDLADA